jgi:hypothetical protein
MNKARSAGHGAALCSGSWSSASPPLWSVEVRFFVIIHIVTRFLQERESIVRILRRWI